MLKYGTDFWRENVSMIIIQISLRYKIYFCGIPSSCSNIADVSNFVFDLFGVLSVEWHPPETIPSHMTCLLWGEGRGEAS